MTANEGQATEVVRPLLSEVLTLSDEALVAFVDFVRVNNPKFTRDPVIIRRVFTAYLMSDGPTNPDSHEVAGVGPMTNLVRLICPRSGTPMRRYELGVFLCEDHNLCGPCGCTPGDQGDCWCERPDGAETTDPSTWPPAATEEADRG